LHDPSNLVRQTALEILPKTAFQVALDDIIRLAADPVPSVRGAAISALVRLGPDREETIAALMEALNQPSGATAAGETQFTRQDAAAALAGLGPKAKPALPELTRLLGDPDDETREAAATALWKIGQDPHTIPVLVELLENARDYQACSRILKLLGEMGPAAKSAVPVIRKKIEDPGVSFAPATVDLVQIALDSLAKVDPAAAAEARKKAGESAR
jgi:HEAT repeat protein